MKGIPVLAALVLILAEAGYASDLEGGYSAKGVGVVTCGKFVADYDIDRFTYGQWILGYITAYNNYVFQGYDVANRRENEALLLFVKNYCEMHPLDDVIDGVGKLIDELRAR